jgi:hypothetical protein
VESKSGKAAAAAEEPISAATTAALTQAFAKLLSDRVRAEVELASLRLHGHGRAGAADGQQAADPMTAEKVRAHGPD